MLRSDTILVYQVKFILLSPQKEERFFFPARRNLTSIKHNVCEHFIDYL